MSTVEDYQKQREQEDRELEELINSIAEAMTGNWVMQPCNGNRDGRTIQEEGTPYRLWIWKPYQKGGKIRLEVSGLFRVDNEWIGDYVRDRPKEITVSAERPPAAIAKDIERRLLSEYKQKMSEAIIGYTNAKKLEADADAATRRLAAVIGGHVPKRSNRGGEHVFYISHYNNPRVVSVDGGVNEFNKTVSLKLDYLTEEQATTVLRLFYPSPHYTRQLNLQPKTRTEGVQNQVQYIINLIEEGEIREALLQAVDLLDDLQRAEVRNV